MSNPLAADLDHILDHTRELWEEMRGERIFITGGTAFFGHWLLESFLWANQRLNLDSHATVLTRSPENFLTKAPQFAGHKSLKVLSGDMRSFDFPPGQFSYVIHAATETAAQRKTSPPLSLFNGNVDGTRHILEFSELAGTQKMLFTSSGAVYGRQPPELTHIPEDYPGAPATVEPQTAYGQSKRAAEFLCAAHAQTSSLQVKIARCFAFVGPWLPLDANFAVGNFIRDGLRGGPIRVNGDGTPYRSFLYAADLAIALWTILFRGQSCRPYNVGSEQEITIQALANAVAQAFTPAPEVRIAKQPEPNKTVERYVPSTRRLVSELELHPTIDLQESIRRTVAWAISQKQGD